MQVIWILYDGRGHYDALLPSENVDKVAVAALQKAVLKAAKDEAKAAKLRARRIRPAMHLQRNEARVQNDEDSTDIEVQELCQGLDSDGVVRDLAAYLEGASAVVRRRLPLVFPLVADSNTNVRVLHISMYEVYIFMWPCVNVVTHTSLICLQQCSVMLYNKTHCCK
jgi:hypothetical protein